MVSCELCAGCEPDFDIGHTDGGGLTVVRWAGGSGANVVLVSPTTDYDCCLTRPPPTNDETKSAWRVALVPGTRPQISNTLARKMVASNISFSYDATTCRRCSASGGSSGQESSSRAGRRYWRC
jgi:hypothetical protein